MIGAAGSRPFPNPKASSRNLPGLCRARQFRLLLNRRHVLLGWGSAFAEEILLHLFNDSLLIFPASRIQAILIQQHLAEFRPTSPRFLGDVVINLLSEYRVKGWLIQARKFLM